MNDVNDRRTPDAQAIATEPLLRVTGLGKSFSGVRVLQDVDLETRRGEVVALVGENGAGKSTVKNILCGLLNPDEGAIELEGHPISHFRAADHGIAAVHQEFSLFGSLSVAENICITDLPGDTLRINWARTREIAQEALDIIGTDIDPDTIVETLSTGRQQLVEIAKALRQARLLLILDEPTASLTEPEREQLFDVIDRLKARGLSIIFISHFIDEVYRVSDRIVVLRDGRRVGGAAKADLPRHELEALMVGRPFEARQHTLNAPDENVVLRVAGFSSPPVVHDVSFKLHRGEILGIAGLMGAGRTELVEAIYGLRPSQGEVWIGEQAVPHRTPETMKQLGVAFVPEDRRRHGLFMNRSLRENMTAAALARLVHRVVPGIGFRGEDASATQIAGQLRVIHAGMSRPVRTLSGGNQQKVLLGRWLAIQPQICIFDEPTRGVDIGAKEEIHQLIVELARQGTAVLLVSSDLPEIMALSHRILTMHKGRLSGELARDEFDAGAILRSASAYEGKVAVNA